MPHGVNAPSNEGKGACAQLAPPKKIRKGGMKKSAKAGYSSKRG